MYNQFSEHHLERDKNIFAVHRTTESDRTHIEGMRKSDSHCQAFTQHAMLLLYII